MKSFLRPCGLLSVFGAIIILLFSSLNTFSQQAWNQVPSPDASITRSMLRGISGTSSADVWAVGSFETPTPGYLKNLVMHWNGTGWQIIPGTDQSITFNDLWDVTAISENDVWAVGAQNEFATTRSQLMHWNGSGWSHTILPGIPGGSMLFAIDAISPTDIWAVGAKAGSPTDPPYAIHYNGSGWTEFPAAVPGIYRDWFSDVDGIASNDVWAVGRQSPAYGEFHAMAQHWNGSSWTNSPLPPEIVNPLAELESVTMIATNDVWAIGSTVTGEMLLIHWNGTSWSKLSSSGSSGGKIISRGTDLFAVGAGISYWNGSNWTVIDPLTQLSYPALGSAISFPNGDIWAAGRTYDTAFHTLVYRTAHITPQFVHGVSQSVNMAPNSSPQNIDEMLKVEDNEISQVLYYNLVKPPSHGTLNGLPDTAITAAGFAKTTGVTYMPQPGYIGSDDFQVSVNAGPLSSLLTVNVNILSALPVSISSYTIMKDGSVARIQWSTTEEINAGEFVVQRSTDGANYYNLNRVAAVGSAHNYSLTDPLPVAGWNYYRLMLIDKDGKETYYPVKGLYFERSVITPFNIYPNPVISGEVSVRLNVEGEYRLHLYTQQGQEILSRMVNSSDPMIQLQLPRGIQPGLYLLSLSKDKIIWTEKIIVW